jgi:hypothetical protein
VNATMLVALIFAVLLGAEWHYGLRRLRLAAALLALLVLSFAQPVYHRAWRVAVMRPPAERVTHLRGKRMLDYMSGVSTMELAVTKDAEMGAGSREMALGVLFWLACSPVLRRGRRPSVETPR